MGKTSYKSKSKAKKISLVYLITIIAGLIIAYFSYDFIHVDEPVGSGSGVVSDANFAVHFIDVGQGDSTLITSDGYSILIDAGENDKGVDVVRYIKNQGIEKLDLVVSTHPHSDHIGGLDVVINEIKVEKVLINRLQDELVPTTRSYTDFLNAVKDNSLKLTASQAGVEYEFGKGKLSIIGPTFVPDDINNSSIVARFTYGEKSFLFTGDMEKESEQSLLDSNFTLKSDVLKVAHHGSKSSTTSAFLEEVAPTIAVISVADGNKYYHPHGGVLDNLEENGVRVFRTDYDKNIVITLVNGKLSVVCE